MEMVVQVALIEGYYRCQLCLRDVERVIRVNRFWLCQACRDKIVPGFPKRQNRRGEWGWIAETAEERAEVDRFLGHIRELEEMYNIPLDRTGRDYRRWRPKELSRETDAYYPLCECGRPRQKARFGEPGLFGGPFLRYCEVCDLRRQVEAVARMADKLAPGRDDEEWLDLLYESHRRAFELGILPDLWFELMRSQGLGIRD